jgi:hypothetical protein
VFTQEFSVYAITYQYAEYAIYAKILKQYAKILEFTQWYAKKICYASY